MRGIVSNSEGSKACWISVKKISSEEDSLKAANNCEQKCRQKSVSLKKCRTYKKFVRPI